METETVTRFAPGRLIVHRNVRHGRIGWVRTARVVHDDDRGLLLWLPEGAPTANEVAADGREMRGMPFTEWLGLDRRLATGSWQGPGVLKLLPAERPGAATFAAHSVWWFRDRAGRFANWYVNLEDPGVRWDDGALAGVDIIDQDLDVVVEPDRSWWWKDEGEFAERLAFPDDYWVTSEEAVRAEGRRVIDQVEAGVFPFDGTWVDFVPDSGLSVPASLPAGWDRPAAPR